METLEEVLARERRCDDPALVTADGRERSYREVLANAYRAGNALRHLGVGRGVEVAVAPAAELPPLLSFLGAGLLGARVGFDPEAGLVAGARALVVPAPADAAVAADTSPGTKLVVFGDEPTRPTATHWERLVWSENPAFPPADLDPADPLLVTDGPDRDVTHGAALAAAAAVVDRYGLESGSRVVVRSSLARPRTVVAGLLAPLRSGGTTVLAPAGGPDGRGTAGTGAGAADARGDLAVGDGPEPRTLDPDDVPLLR